jgi:flavin-dependent dehydrogenase
MTDVDVAIVGAGAAGLAAAVMLREAGRSTLGAWRPGAHELSAGARRRLAR